MKPKNASTAPIDMKRAAVPNLRSMRLALAADQVSGIAKAPADHACQAGNPPASSIDAAGLGTRASCEGARGPNPRDASPFGCQDMAGHLAEWTATAGSVNPEARIVRGGHWQSPLDQCTTWTRQEVPLTRRLPTLGFRCASD